VNQPLPTDGEVAWSKWLAEQMGGEAEYRLPCKSRVDILTTTLAIEVDWVKKWPEAFGQAIYYGVITNRPAAVLLLLRGKLTEDRYLERARQVGARLNVSVFTWMTTDTHNENVSVEKI